MSIHQRSEGPGCYKYFVGYGGLLTWIFKKFGVPLDGLHFPMSPNNKIGAKCE